MRTYTLDELKKLASIRLKGFDNSYLDDNYTNDYADFKNNTDIFLDWLNKMESQNKIDFLISEYDKCN